MRLIFHCVDSEGNAVDVETSDLEVKNLSAALENAKKIIAELGLTQSKANGNGNGKAKPKEKVIIDGIHCPSCGKSVWDNRSVKVTDAAKAKWPDFSCKEKCGFAVWPGQYTMLNGNGA